MFKIDNLINELILKQKAIKQHYALHNDQVMTVCIK